MISMLIPVRRDSVFLRGLIHSIYANVYDHLNIEIIVSLSKRDEYNREWLTEYPDINVIFTDKRRGRYSLDRYMNELAVEATGLFLWHLCDDHRIVCDNFDARILEHAEIADQIYYLSPYSRQVGVSGASAPIITRAWLETTGTFAKHYAVDSYVNTVVENLPPKRRIMLGTVLIEDVSLMYEPGPKCFKDADFDPQSLDGEPVVMWGEDPVVRKILGDAQKLNNAIKKGK